MILELLALRRAGLSAGAALYITLVVHPARLPCGNAVAITQFGPSYRRATRTQASLAAVGCLAPEAAWARGCGTSALVAGPVLGVP